MPSPRALPLLAALVTCGCMMQQLAQDLNEQSRFLHTFAGRVTVADWSGAPIVVAVMRPPERDGLPFQIVDYVQLFEPGPYRFLLRDGRYRVVAFVDENRDLDYQPNEPVASHGGFLDVVAQGGGMRDGLDIHITGEPPIVVPEVAHPTGEVRSLYVGEVRPLDDERMGPEAARIGVWEPLRYMQEIGAGLSFLEPYRDDRVPVVFVHGMGGHPREFTHLIERLDRRRFQPWFVRYPSGWALDVSADFFNRALNEMQTRHGFTRLCIVAHSMGGVVSRHMLALHRGARPRSFIHGFVTIASPLGGHPAAAAGVVMAPAVVPSWRSIEPGSTLIQELYRTPLPEETRYALLFAFDGRGPSDGVVPLTSQLRPEAQAEAELVRGFHGTHVGVLEDADVSALVNARLGRCYEGFAPPSSSAPPSAR